MIADTDLSIPRVHLQDAMFIYRDDGNLTEMIKRAVLKYGSLTVQKMDSNPSEAPNATSVDIEVMEHGTHFVSIKLNDYY